MAIEWKERKPEGEELCVVCGKPEYTDGYIKHAFNHDFRPLYNKSIPELTETQVQIMKFVVMETPVFLIRLSREGDTPEVLANIAVSLMEATKLVELGFLEDITDKAKLRIDQLEIQNGRKHRMFAATILGKAFFQAAVSQSIN